MSRGHSTAPYFSLTIINHLDDHRPGYSLRSIAVYGKGQPSESYRHLHNCAANGTITLEAEAGMRQRRRLGLSRDRSRGVNMSSSQAIYIDVMCYFVALQRFRLEVTSE